MINIYIGSWSEASLMWRGLYLPTLQTHSTTTQELLFKFWLLFLPVICFVYIVKKRQQCVLACDKVCLLSIYATDSFHTASQKENSQLHFKKCQSKTAKLSPNFSVGIVASSQKKERGFCYVWFFLKGLPSTSLDHILTCSGMIIKERPHEIT